MSSSLYWRPVPTAPDGDALGSQLKYAIARDLFDQDGSCPSEWITVDRDFVSFLRGIAAAAGQNNDLKAEAEQLIELINRYAEVQLRIMR